jgi:eukaryotic-like serine/threonine-protein kinase
MPESWKECEGQVVGEFKLLQHLGGSDHSVVFLTERGKCEKAAIKFVQADPATSDSQIARWRQATQLPHPNLIKLFESGRCQLTGMDLLYVVMEYASENLAEFLPQRALTPDETRDMLEPFAETITFLHDKGFVHGHIEPGNILAINDQLKLSSDSICRAGERPIGTAKPDVYTPPESADSGQSTAGDIWSLGITLVEALTQHVPDRNASPTGEEEELPVVDSLPEPFADIAHHCLRFDPARRWSIAEISASLKSSSAPESVVAASAAAAAAATTSTSATVSPPEEVAKPATATAVAVETPKPKPTGSIDPLSVPLSPVPPLPPTPRLTLQNQVVAGKRRSSNPLYAVVAVSVALIIGAFIVIPKLLNRQADEERAGATQGASGMQSPTQPSTTPAPSTSTNAPEKSDASAENESAEKSGSMSRTNGDKPSVKKDLSAADAAPASLRDAAPQSEVVPPFVANRDASIAKGAVTPGEVINQVLPDISQRSRSTIRGTVRVIIKAHVDSAGSVTSAEIASGPSHFFANAALESVYGWDFAPAKIEGHAVPSEWLVHFDFTHSGTNVTPLQAKP